MTKRKFWEKVRNMENPIIEEKINDFYPFLNCYLFIYDDNGNKFETEMVRLSRKEYNNGHLEDYYKREKRFKLKCHFPC